MNFTATYKNVLRIFADNTDPENRASGTTEETPRNNSLMHLMYKQKVNDGLITNDTACTNCICFGDEWPL